MSALAATINRMLSPEPAPLPPVKVRVDMPQPVFDAYKRAADDLGRDVEEYIGDHLRQTARQDHSGAGIWFSQEQARALSKLTGRGPCTDPDVILKRLQPLCEVIIGDVIVELDAQVIDRLKHIRRGLTPAQFVTREAVNGVRLALGLGPK